MVAAPVQFYRLAAVGLIVAGLALSGCGRKGPLDAPPGGLAATAADGTQQEAATSGEVIRQGGPRGLPLIRGQDKRIPLDALLN